MTSNDGSTAMAKRKKKRLGERIIEALTDFCEVAESGESLEKHFTVRTVELDLKPGQYDPKKIRAIRAALGVSQAIFAQIMGASLATIEAWEQGHRMPSPMACRLLDEINRDQQGWIKRLKAAVKIRRPA